MADKDSFKSGGFNTEGVYKLYKVATGNGQECKTKQNVGNESSQKSGQPSDNASSSEKVENSAFGNGAVFNQRFNAGHDDYAYGFQGTIDFDHSSEGSFYDDLPEDEQE